jgi:DNA-binding transcriptional ArsR family regulator
MAPFVDEAALDRLFSALADRTRRRLLARLVVRPAMVTELARPFAMSLPAVSKHIRLLEQAGLVRRSIDGRIHRCRLEAAPLELVEVWLDPFRSYWDGQFRDLAARLPPTPRRRARSGRPPRRPVNRAGARPPGGRRRAA